MPKAIIIVPCYNEARRFDATEFDALARLPDTSVLFVNDGSTDRTVDALRAFCRNRGEIIQVMNLEKNRGKGEAVRLGMLRAVEERSEIVGYYDADLSTPVAEMARIISVLGQGDFSVVMGSRIRHLGASIDRSLLRHYVGRVFSTLSSKILRAPVYDTQCGAKAFRNGPQLVQALREPFVSRWCFDIELLGRLLIGTPDCPPLSLERFRELPLRRWQDVPGSKIGPRNSLQIAYELTRVALDLHARRRHRRGEAG